MSTVSALQKALAAEHAAVYLYGVLGARASKSAQPVLFGTLTDTFEEHRDARDQLSALISKRGTDPVASGVDYELPGPVGSPAQIQAVARTLETRITRTYGELVAGTSGADRKWAIQALDAAALRAQSFGARPSAYPGID